MARKKLGTHIPDYTVAEFDAWANCRKEYKGPQVSVCRRGVSLVRVSLFKKGFTISGRKKRR